MEVEEIVNVTTSIISNVGFPIFCACMMFVQMYFERKSREADNERWRAQLESNTSALLKIVDVLRGVAM